MASSDAHDLIPRELARRIPPLYGTEHQDDAIAHVKLFSPFSSWSWFIVEFDPEERLCFGLVIGHEREMGYFSLEQLESLRGPGDLRIERDLYFEPTPLSRCR